MSSNPFRIYTENYRNNLPNGVTFDPVTANYFFNGKRFPAIFLVEWYRQYLFATTGFTGGFNPAVLFANNEPGVWYDPNDLDTLFQDTAGTTPVTTPGQTVGLMLDKSKGLTLGPELVTNGDFSGGSTGWTVGAGWSISGGQAVYSRTTGTTTLQQSGYAANKYYKVEFDVIGTTGSIDPIFVYFGDGITIREPSATVASGTTGRISCVLPSNSFTSLVFRGRQNTGSFTATIDNISVKELPGFHATQPTAAARPTYQTDGTYHWLEFDGVDDFMVTPTITPGIDKVQVFAGVRKLSDVAGFGVIAEYGPASAGTFSLTAPAAAGTNTYLWSSRGSFVTGGADSAIASGYAAPITNILTGVGEISTDTMILRVDGVQAGSSSFNQGTGNFLAYPMFIGSRGGTSLRFNGHIHQLITRFGANLDVAQIESTEAYVAGKTAGVDL